MGRVIYKGTKNTDSEAFLIYLAFLINFVILGLKDKIAPLKNP